MRYDFNDYAIPKWKAYLEIKDRFDRLTGSSIYRLLPDVIENSFGYKIRT